jgi:hypothetical protein
MSGHRRGKQVYASKFLLALYITAMFLNAPSAKFVVINPPHVESRFGALVPLSPSLLASQYLYVVINSPSFFTFSSSSLESRQHPSVRDSMSHDTR